MPPLKTGTLTLDDLKKETVATVADFGPERVYAAVQAELDAHNANMNEMIAPLADRTTDLERGVVGSNPGKMRRVDEAARVSTQKGQVRDRLGFPLHKLQYSVGFTRDFEMRASPREVAIEITNAQIAHRLEVQADLRRALFGALNYTFVDYMGRAEHQGLAVGVKGLYNADGMVIPPNRNGTAFDAATHTHYQYATALSDTVAQAMVTNLIEHDLGQGVVIQINVAQEGAWRGLAGFTALPFPVGPGSYQAPNQPATPLDVTTADNRLIGYFNGIPVWTRPWVPANYAIAQALGDGARRPLAIRELTPGSMALQPQGEIDLYPFRTQYLVSYYGVGVQDRANGVILYVAGGASAYVVPSFPT